MKTRFTSRKRTTRMLSLLLLSALLFTSIPVTAQAASKPKKIVWVNSAKKRTTYAKEKIQMQTKVSPSSAKQAVSYSSSNKSVATVSKSGKVTFKKKGTVTITAKTKAKPTRKVTCKFTVKYEKLKFTATVPTLIAGATFANPVKNPNKKTILYSSSNPAVCKVDSKGTLTAVGMGSATITAKAKDGKMTASKYTVEVLPKLETSKVKFVAHRGLSSEAPDNSLAGFRLAGQTGFWGIETDVMITKDRQFILSHDAKVGNTVLLDHDRDYLNQNVVIPAGAGGGHDKYPNEKLPTLGQYLDICNQYGKVPVIEIKWVNDYSNGTIEFYDSETDGTLQATLKGISGLTVGAGKFPNIGKSGWHFDYWYTVDENGMKKPIDITSAKYPASNKTVAYYAHWTAESSSNPDDLASAEVTPDDKEIPNLDAQEVELSESDIIDETISISDVAADAVETDVISPDDVETEIIAAEDIDETVDFIDTSDNFLTPSEVTVNEDDDPAILEAEEDALIVDENGELSLMQAVEDASDISDNYVEKLYDEVTSVMNDKPVVFISFDSNALQVMKKVMETKGNKAITLQYLIGSKANVDNAISICKTNGFGLDASYANSGLTNDKINSLSIKSGAGLGINLWTVNTYMDVYNSINRGTDFITTNYKWW